MMTRGRFLLLLTCSGVTAAVLFAIMSRGTDSASGPFNFPGNDQACGARCLVAITKLTEDALRDVRVESIYASLGRRVGAPLSMMDVQRAARKLGYSAQAHMWTYEDLLSANGYVVLLLGKSRGSEADPLHYVLLEKASPTEGLLIDPRSLKYIPCPREQIERNWRGYALEISAGRKNEALPKGRGRGYLATSLPGKQDLPDEIWDAGAVPWGKSASQTFWLGPATEKPQIVGRNCSCLIASISERDAQCFLSMTMGMNSPGARDGSVIIRRGHDETYQRYVVRAVAAESVAISPNICTMLLSREGAASSHIAMRVCVNRGEEVKVVGLLSASCDLRLENIHLEKLLRLGQYDVHVIAADLVRDRGISDPNCMSDVARIGVTVNGKSIAGSLRVILVPGRSAMQVFPSSVFMVSTPRDGTVAANVEIKWRDDTNVSGMVCSVEGLPLRVGHVATTNRCMLLNIDLPPGRAMKLDTGKHSGTVIVSAAGGSDSDIVCRIPVTIYRLP